MRHTPLRRLSSTDHMGPDLPLHIYRQSLHDANGAGGVHWHEFYEVGFILEGQGRHILNGTAHRVQRGSCFLLTPADFHDLRPASGETLELFDVVFLADVLQGAVYRLLFHALHSYRVDFSQEEAQRIEQELQRLYDESNTHQVGSELIMIGTLERILIDLLRHSQHQIQKPAGENAATTQHQKLSMSLIYLHHHFREPLTLQEVAQQVHLSPTYFSEYFHQVYGITFQQYLQDLRLRFAHSLLTSSSVPISHVYAAAGFQTLSHFERAFKRRFGLTPRQTRTRPSTADSASRG
ncbi:AraC family transcriptional regulator [Dictyobacter sp. S3.2.2.5]|uniref:AraC family transcriptional regulator n=1 Tax=Dictyobacter halimunensis TaxID=3026934 RepID=A0ABQ6FSE3_9CHLR|nr:AraC family transcriptional regulator [Dictyobacter sp. S3.2.2.5]